MILGLIITEGFRAVHSGGMFSYPKGPNLNQLLLDSMNNTPQNVSIRYITNLLTRGSNSQFEIDYVAQKIACTPGGLPVGFYYVVGIKTYPNVQLFEGEGATPVAAGKSALTQHGVTFR